MTKIVENNTIIDQLFFALDISPWNKGNSC